MQEIIDGLAIRGVIAYQSDSYRFAGKVRGGRLKLNKDYPNGLTKSLRNCMNMVVGLPWQWNYLSR